MKTLIYISITLCLFLKILCVQYYNVISSLQNIPIMTATFLPPILVPLVGLVFSAISMALFFLYISSDDIS